MADSRPTHFPPGTALGTHYTVEGLVRLAEGRMFYLANDQRPDLSTRKCWECGHEDTPKSQSECASCGAGVYGSAVPHFMPMERKWLHCL